MEDGVFHRTAVADILEHRYVEARLHTDYSENMQRELKMVQSYALPIFVIMDPDDESLHAKWEGALGLGATESDFIGFLNAGWDSAKPSTASGAE